MFNIALVGLPSAGKSSIINSLLGKRVAQSGICRTTLESKLYSDLESDDGIKYNIYDLPGIADIEDKDQKFDTMIFETIQNCNLVLWISDITKAFITNHELKEYKKIETHINDLGIKEGIPIQLGILLSKVDDNLDDVNSTNDDDKFDTCPEDDEPVNVASDDEIRTEEETTTRDIYQKVKDKFTDVSIICFNAHGRSYYHKKSTPNLKKFVKQYKPQNVNISFRLKHFVDQIPVINDMTKIKYFIETKFKVFLNSYVSCDTTNINMPNNLVLWCNQSNCLAKDCKNDKCIDCSNDRYWFRCKAHKQTLCYNQNQYILTIHNSTLWTTHSYVNYCTNSHEKCNVSFAYNSPTSKITCKHGYKINRCVCAFDFKSIATAFTEVFNSIYSNDIKAQLIRFLLNDIYLTENNMLGLKIDQYNCDIWNSICSNVKVNVKSYYNYLDYVPNLSPNQIYRLIQIGADFVLEDKIFLYTLIRETTLTLHDRTFIINQPIYNLEYLISGEVFEQKGNTEFDNKKYEKEIYKTSILKIVKDIRKSVYGDTEDDIDISMIPIAYEKYGLIWKL